MLPRSVESSHPGGMLDLSLSDVEDDDDFEAFSDGEDEGEEDGDDESNEAWGGVWEA